MSYKIKLINLFVILILSSLIVNAFGVTLPYNPVNGYGEIGLEPGQKQEIIFLLQNTVGDEDIKVQTSLKEGKEIAILENEGDIFVPKHTKDTKIKIKLAAPKTATISNKWLVRVYFKELGSDQGGAAFLTTGIEQRFYVQVVAPPNFLDRLNRRLPFRVQDTIGFLVIVIILITWLFYIKKRIKK